MKDIKTIQQQIVELDAEARRQLAAAAAEGRFDDLVQLTPIAKEIAALATRWLTEIENEPTENDLVPARKVRSDDSAEPAEPKVSDAHGTRSRPKKSDYPSFLREKDELVKLGWSPREKGPYEHRVPKVGTTVVVSAVAKTGKAGHRFTMDEIVKEIAATNGSEPVPSYQVYAVVSWLKWAGMVLQHGRQGYTIVRPQTFASAVEAAWQSLPQR